MAASIYEIARKADVSVATVSRVLNRSPKIKKETRDRVLSIIEKSNYSPRVSRTKTKRIVIIAPPFRNIFTSHYVTKALAAITDYDFPFTYELIFLPRSVSGAVPKELFYFLKTENIFFAIFLYGLVEHENILYVAEKKFPHIALGGKYPKQERINWIDPDNINGTVKIVQYLISLGHREIALVNTPKYLISSEERAGAYRNTLSENGLEVKEKLVIFSGGTKPEDGYESAMELLTHSTPPTAVFAGNDNIAFGIYRALAKSGYRIPDDVSVVGFDDIPLAEHLIPPLTTVHIPWDRVGQRVGEIIQMYHATGELPFTQEVVNTDFILRSSTTNPRKTNRDA